MFHVEQVLTDKYINLFIRYVDNFVNKYSIYIVSRETLNNLTILVVSRETTYLWVTLLITNLTSCVKNV